MFNETINSNNNNNNNIMNNLNTQDKNTFIYETIVLSLTIPLFILTTAGNGIILITIKFQARLLSSNSNYLNSNYFILNLAIADFFVGILVMPFMIIFTVNKAKWTYSQELCDSWMAFDFLCSTASFLTLSAMSIERYKMLTTSYMRIKNSSKFRIIIFICLSWILPFVSWIPVIVAYRFLYGPNSYGDCSSPANKYLVLFLCILLYHIPLIFMVVFYTKLIIHIRKSSISNDINNHPTDMDSTSLNLNKNRPIFHLNNINNNNSKSISNNDLNENNQLNRNNTNNINNNIINNNNEFSYHSNNELNLLRNNSIKSRKSLSQNFLPTNINNLNLQRKRSISQPTFLSRIIQTTKFKNCLNTNKDETINFRKKSDEYNLSIIQQRSLKYHQNGFKRRTNNSNNAINCSIRHHSYVNSHYNNSDHNNNSSVRKLSLNENDLMVTNRNDFDLELNEAKKNELMLIINKSPTNYVINKFNNSNYRFSFNNKKDTISLFENSNYQNLRLKRNRKAARMLGLLVTCFLICWTPFSICYPLGQFLPHSVPSYFTLIIWWMGYLNSAINPFLYVYSNKTIRRSVRDLFYKRIWQFFTGSKKMNRNFRTNSLKNFNNQNHPAYIHQNGHAVFMFKNQIQQHHQQIEQMSLLNGNNMAFNSNNVNNKHNLMSNSANNMNMYVKRTFRLKKSYL